MEFFNSPSITLNQFYYYQLLCILNQRTQGMNYQNDSQRNINNMNQLYQLYQTLIQHQQQRQFQNLFDLQQFFDTLYNQTHSYQQIPQSINQINIGNTIHQVNYNINHETEPQVSIKQQETKQQVIQHKQEKIEEKQEDNLNIVIPKNPKLIKNALKQTQEKSNIIIIDYNYYRRHQ